jgi:hypothetical protein
MVEFENYSNQRGGYEAKEQRKCVCCVVQISDSSYLCFLCCSDLGRRVSFLTVARHSQAPSRLGI